MFDGTNYCGWQVQKNGISIQQTLQDALQKVLNERPDVMGCSRTDSGVHANNFYVNFKSENPLECEAILRALNFYLPHDIAVLECHDMPIDFHARYSALGKEYIYKIYNGKIRNPFNEKYALYYPYKIDCDLINKAAVYFIGKHDFKAFMAKGSSVKDTVRTITELRAEQSGDLIIIRISADGFLYNMVRIITGTLLDICRGKIKPDDIADIIVSKDRNKAGSTVKPHGLYLNRVFYEN